MPPAAPLRRKKLRGDIIEGITLYYSLARGRRARLCELPKAETIRAGVGASSGRLQVFLP